MSPPTPAALKDWLGKTEEQTDRLDPVRLEQAAAMLGLAQSPDVLPPLWHLFFCNEVTAADDLAADGHARLGGFMPPVGELGAFNRRMWAAGDVHFDGELRAGEAIKRTSNIRDIRLKEGRSGALVFVDLERLIEGQAGQVREIRTIVYRHFDGQQTAPEDQPLSPEPGLTALEHWHPDERALFRFSALTWNTHRIHYDRRFCQQVEGYPDILVHGPLTALKLAGLAAADQEADRQSDRATGPLKRFSFRGLQPLFVNRPIQLCGAADGRRYQALNHAGHLAMTAQVER